jgi:hypothetical protein
MLKRKTDSIQETTGIKSYDQYVESNEQIKRQEIIAIMGHIAEVLIMTGEYKVPSKGIVAQPLSK